MPPVKIAIVGCGLVTEEMHVPAALACRNLEIAALVDADRSRAALLARKYGLACPIATTLDAPILDAVEGVLIATPNHTHAPLARLALERRRPVFVEKPFTVTYAEAMDVLDLARRMGAFVSVGFVTRHFPVVGLLKRLIHDGFFGCVQHFEFEYGTKGGWAPASGYTLSRSQAGGGVLVTNGTHFLDRMLYWFGYPTRFRYADDSHGGVEANCKASLEFETGLTGTLFLSKTMALKNRLLMKTDRGIVVVPYSEPNEITIRVPDTPDLVMSVRGAQAIAGADAFRLQLEEFGRNVRNEGCPTVPGDAGAESVRLCEDFYARRQELEEPWMWYRETVTR